MKVRLKVYSRLDVEQVATLAQGRVVGSEGVLVALVCARAQRVPDFQVFLLLDSARFLRLLRYRRLDTNLDVGHRVRWRLHRVRTINDRLQLDLRDTSLTVVVR